MEVSYTLTTEDLRAYLDWGARQPATRAVLRRSRLLGSMLFVCIAAILALSGTTGSAAGGRVLFTIAGIVLVFGVIAWFTLPARMRSSYVKRSLGALASGKTAYLLGPRTARITPEGFALSGPGISAAYAWSVVDHVAMSASGVYVFMNAQQAHVVPRSAFASHEAMEGFAHAAEGYLRAVAAA